MAALFFTHVGGPVYRTAVLLVKSIDVGPSGEQESHHLKVAKKTKNKQTGDEEKTSGDAATSTYLSTICNKCSDLYTLHAVFTY